jgi:integrase/recombinase XerD
MTLTEACKQFLKHCESAISLSHHSLKAYSSDLDDTQQYFGVRKKIASVERDHLRQYIRHLRGQRLFKEATIKRRLASLKLLFKWAIEEEFIKTNPFDSLNERIRLPKRLPRALDRGDQATLRKALVIHSRTDGFDVVRNKTIIHLLLDTGIRVGELVVINLSDLSLANGSLVINGKGNRQRLVYLLKKPLYRKIEQYLVSRKAMPDGGEKLFITSSCGEIRTPHVRVALRGIAEKAGVTRHVTPHMLRHTCATQWLEDGLDIRYVQKLLGHQSISTTEIYTHVSDQGLREALARVAGGGKR